MKASRERRSGGKVLSVFLFKWKILQFAIWSKASKEGRLDAKELKDPKNEPFGCEDQMQVH